MPDFPKTGASVIVLDGDKTLLIKRGKEPYKGCWSLPGGSQIAGETLAECARRELREETFLEVGAMILAAVRDRIKHDENGTLIHHYVLATYLAEDFKGEPIANDDADDVGWFTLDEMDDIATTPDTAEFISSIMNDL